VRQIRLYINKPTPYTATCLEFQQSVRHKRVTDKQIKRIYTNPPDKTMNVYLATDLSNEQALRNKLGNVGHTHSVIILAISKKSHLRKSYKPIEHTLCSSFSVCSPWNPLCPVFVFIQLPSQREQRRVTISKWSPLHAVLFQSILVCAIDTGMCRNSVVKHVNVGKNSLGSC
jgi:hypothetical protein